MLRQGGVYYGYLPFQDVSQRGYLSQHGYTFDPWISWSINYIPMNMTNPTSGPIFRQLYFRQAVQHLVDQKTMISNIFKGYANPTYGPVPVKPASPFVTSFERSNPYPFDSSAAVKLLKDNGWNVVPDGVSTCANPGTGKGQCGQGVAAGAKASFSFLYSSGQQIYSQVSQVLKSALAKAGIQINVSQAPFNTVISTATPCKPGEACSWDMAFWGGGWVYAPDFYPTGDELWSTDAGSNSGGYSNPTNDANTEATLASNDVKPLNTYEDFLAKDLPVIWFPNQDFELTEVKTNLKGVFPQDPLLAITPENWYFTK